MLIGKVTKIMRYPVKSMKGEEVKEVFVSYSGLMGDRVYAFVDKEKENNFPWLSARQYKEMLLYEPTYLSEIDVKKQFPNKSLFNLNVKTPEGNVYDINDNNLIKELQEKTGKQLEVRFSEAGMQDSRPVSIVSNQSVVALRDEMNQEINPLRFRMNLYVDWNDNINNNNKAFYEDELIGKKIKIGNKLILEINKKDGRCVVITHDPKTVESDPEILKHVAREHKGTFGVYAIVVREGIVKENDEIELLD